MILVQNILVHEDIISETFKCHLEKCKGACCVEGDFGAPLEEYEINMIKDIIHILYPELSTTSQKILDQGKYYEFYSQINSKGTPLHSDGSCIYLIKDEVSGITQCGFEKIYHEDKSDFRKPISCHLYPIRVNKNEELGFEALNYDRWDICASACDLGKLSGTPIYQFCQDALVRQYGLHFYEELDQIANELNGPRMDRK